MIACRQLLPQAAIVHACREAHRHVARVHSCVSLGFNVLAFRSGSDRYTAKVAQSQGYKFRSFLDNTFCKDVQFLPPRAVRCSNRHLDLLQREKSNDSGPGTILSQTTAWHTVYVPRFLQQPTRWLRCRSSIKSASAATPGQSTSSLQLLVHTYKPSSSAMCHWRR